MRTTRIMAILVLALGFVGSATANWVTSGDDMYADIIGNVGIGTTSPESKLRVIASSSDSVNEWVPAIYGRNEGEGDGVYGWSQNRHGTFGVTEYILGHGVHGEAKGTRGVGVYGKATSTDYFRNYGGYFTAAGEQGVGVYGEATSTAPGGGDPWEYRYHYGGLFKMAGGQGAGVRGEGPIGGSFVGEGADSYGVYATGTIAVFAQGYGNGVFAKASDDYGEAIHGEATGTHAEGVMGRALGSNGDGVSGWGRDHDFFAWGPGQDYGSSSSIRWKTDIQPIDDPLGMVLRLRGVYFNWDEQHGGEHDVGMIAEEVGEVLPEVVSYEPDGKYTSGMDYSRLTPLLVEAVKALNTKTAELEGKLSQLESLRKENADLHNRINTMEARLAQLVHERSNLADEL